MNNTEFNPIIFAITVAIMVTFVLLFISHIVRVMVFFLFILIVLLTIGYTIYDGLMDLID